MLTGSVQPEAPVVLHVANKYRRFFAYLIDAVVYSGFIWVRLLLPPMGAEVVAMLLTLCKDIIYGARSYGKNVMDLYIADATFGEEASTAQVRFRSSTHHTQSLMTPKTESAAQHFQPHGCGVAQLHPFSNGGPRFDALGDCQRVFHVAQRPQPNPGRHGELLERGCFLSSLTSAQDFRHRDCDGASATSSQARLSVRHR